MSLTVDSYTGRFAPSPSGPLHFGSLVAAVGSYLCARSVQGRWLVRMEDLDPPREQPGAADTILRQLEYYGLHHDGEVLYQSHSHRQQAYRATLEQLAHQGQLYGCRCTRRQIMADGGFYAGTCRESGHEHSDSALRLHNRQPVYRFTDRLQGEVIASHHMAAEDFILQRKDRLFAYQLAVVVDDIYQGISEVVRGADLLEVTVRQLALYQLLGHKAPQFLHLPLAMRDSQQKLSKQNQATAIPCDSPQRAAQTLCAALSFLGHTPPAALQQASCPEILAWATAHWQLAQVPHCQQLPASALP